MLSARILTACRSIVEGSQLRTYSSAISQVRRIRTFGEFLKNDIRKFPKCEIRSRQFCSKPNDASNKPPSTAVPPNASEPAQPLTLRQRFKAAYRQYGKVLIGVHLVLSAGWFSSFYLVASSGVDIAGLLEKWGVINERVSSALRSSAGNAAVAYLLYKIASPVRYAMTLGGTHIAVRALRRWGYLHTPIAAAAKKIVK